jgi:type VI secretion system protein
VLLVGLLAGAVLAGCNVLSNLLDFSTKTALKELDVVAEVGANQDMATALDVVFVIDKNALPVLPRTGPEWFANKGPLLDGLASGVIVLSLQMSTPDQIRAQPLPKGYERALAVYSYANYLSPGGQPLGNLTTFRCALITLKSTRITYQSCGR